LALPFGQIGDIEPLKNLTELKSLNLNNNQVADISPLADMTKLTGLALANNQVKSLDDFPTAPGITVLQLGGNKISSVAPLVGKLDGSVLTTINLSGNRITDASPLAPYGENGGKLGNGTLTISQGLLLANNRIDDFSAFVGWPKNKMVSFRSEGQTLYVGPYPAAGLDIDLKTGDGTVPAVSPAEAGSYDPATGKLTLTDTSAENVTVTPNWTISFVNPPVEPGDDDGPQIGGTVQVGQRLSIAAPGAKLEGTSCFFYSYRWLRDGEEFAGNKYLTNLDHVGSTASSMGTPGSGGTYVVSATDLGHQLSVRGTCVADGVSSTSEPTALVSAEEAEQPIVQGLEGVASNRLVDPAQLQVGASVSYWPGYLGPRPIEADDVHVIGTGATRTIAITPQVAAVSGYSQPGVAKVTLTVTGTTGKTNTYSFSYVASEQTTPTSRVLLGSSDASSAIAVGDGYMLVLDDEKRSIRLYDSEVSGREVAQFSPGTGLGGEIDGEASARKGDRIWWFGSHGNDKDGEYEASRAQVYETKLTGSGASAKITPVGVYKDLRADLIEWDHNHGDRFGFYAAQFKTRPDVINGFDIEGAEFSPDDTELYLGFRAPLAPAQIGGKALIMPVTNLPELTSGAATKATFDDPILLDLGGDSIREMRKNAGDEYLILSAPAGLSVEAPTETLWAWNGERGYAPRRLTTVIPKDVEPNYADNAGVWEGIGEMPDRLTPGAQVRLIMDQGYDKLYGEATENKKDINDFTNKARTDLVTLTGPVGTIAELSGSGAFADQAANTIGSARKLTVTNGGSNVLHVGRVFTEGADDDSANDFIVGNNLCSGQALDPENRARCSCGSHRCGRTRPRMRRWWSKATCPAARAAWRSPVRARRCRRARRANRVRTVRTVPTGGTAPTATTTAGTAPSPSRRPPRAWRRSGAGLPPSPSASPTAPAPGSVPRPRPPRHRGPCASPAGRPSGSRP